MKKNMMILAASLLTFQAFAVQEIPDTSINDFAIASVENEETIIRYNPEYCEIQGSQICKFFMSHEYGHIVLGHPLGGEYTTEEEYAADCWVTQNAPRNLSISAYTYFTNKGDLEDRNQGSDIQRAENILACSEEKSSISEKQLSQDDLSYKKQSKSRTNHYIANTVFTNLELFYSLYFPVYFNDEIYGYETNNNGYIQYTKVYQNGSALAEYRGILYYQIPSFGIYNWTDAGPIFDWF